MSESKSLTLVKAIETGRLQEFIAQREAAGIGPVDPKELDRAFMRHAGADNGMRRSYPQLSLM